MPCAPSLAFPPLPPLGPLSLTPPELPSVSLDVDFCCKLDLTIALPPIPLGPLVIAIPGWPAIVIALNAIGLAIDAYIDALPLSCPFETE